MKSGATCIAYETVTSQLGRAAAAEADERSRRPHVGPGRRPLSREGAGRPRRAARRRARASPRPRSRSSAAASPASTRRKWRSACAPTSPSTTSTTTAWPSSTCSSASQIKTAYASRARSPARSTKAELVIGAVLVPGAAAPKLVTREMLKTMKRGIGAGRHRHRPGRLLRDQPRRPPTTTRSTRSTGSSIIASPTCPARWRGPAPSRSTTRPCRSRSRSPISAPRRRCGQDPHLANGLNVSGGKIRHQAVAEALDLAYEPPEPPERGVRSAASASNAVLDQRPPAGVGRRVGQDLPPQRERASSRSPERACARPRKKGGAG